MSNQPHTPDAPREPTIPLPPPLGPQAWAAPAAQPQPQPQKRSKKHLIGYPVTALVALGIGAAGGGGQATVPASTSPTVVVTQTAPAPPAETVTQTLRATVTVAPPKAPAAAADSGAQAAPKPASKVTVPDGVGLNYQDAQDAWRAAGLIVAPANDATGANRLPVLDSNWVVLDQDLKPGSKVAVGSMITATVKKYTDG